MIAQLSGKIIRKQLEYLVVDTGGVGYQVFGASPLLDTSNVGDTISLIIHTHITESNIQLFGFNQESELSLFNAFISINGIGPKLAMAILSFPADLVSKALMTDDVAYLTTIPGVGKKMAERMILELKSKLDLDISLPQAQATPIYAEAVEALEGLGFTKADAATLLEKAPDHLQTTEELITYALKNKEAKG